MLNDGTDLELKTANGTNMPYESWVELDCGLETAHRENRVRVPMLVPSEAIDQAIIGYNVIEEAIKHDKIPNNDITNLAESLTDVNT